MSTIELCPGCGLDLNHPGNPDRLCACLKPATRRVEAYMSVLPVTFDPEEQPEAYAMVLADVPDSWRRLLRAEGGEPLGEPTVTASPNPHYGWQLSGKDGEPMLDEDGEPMTDPVRLYVTARGRAYRP